MTLLAGSDNPTSSRGNDGRLMSRDGGYTAVASGTATHIYVYVHSQAANGSKIRAGIFDFSTGDLLAQTSEYTWNTASDTEPKWLALPLESTYPIVASTVYHIAAWTNGTILRWGANNSLGDIAFQQITYAASFPDPADITDWDGGLAPTFYIDGTTGGGSEATVSPSVGAIALNGLIPAVNNFTNVRYSEVLINAAGSPVGDRTGLRFTVWYAGQCAGAPDLSYSDLTTGAAGTASYSLATGSLIFGQKVFGVITDGGASLSSYTCGLLTLNYS